MKRKHVLFSERMNGTIKHYPFKRVRTEFLETPQEQQLERVYAALAEEQQDDLQREEKRKAKLEYVKDLYEKKKKDLDAFNKEMEKLPETLAKEYTKVAEKAPPDSKLGDIFFGRSFIDVMNELAERKMRNKMTEMAGIPREYVEFADYMDDIIGEPSFIDKLISENKDEIINYLPMEVESKWLKMLKEHYALSDDIDVRELGNIDLKPPRTSEDLWLILADQGNWKFPLTYRNKKVAEWKDKFPKLDEELEMMFVHDPKMQALAKHRVLAIPEIHQMNSIALQAEKVARNNVRVANSSIQAKPSEIGSQKGVDPKDTLPQLHQQKSIELQAKRIADNSDVVEGRPITESLPKQTSRQVLSEAAKPEMYHANPIEIQGTKMRENSVVASGKQIKLVPGIFARMYNSVASLFSDPLAEFRRKLQFQTPVTIPPIQSSVMGSLPAHQIVLPYKSFEELESVMDTISRLKTELNSEGAKEDWNILNDFLTDIRILVHYPTSLEKEVSQRLQLNNKAARVRDIVRKYPHLVPPRFGKQIHNFI